ncbi:17063_t:CDS:2, partial [Gigaspora margarita]
AEEPAIVLPTATTTSPPSTNSSQITNSNLPPTMNSPPTVTSTTKSTKPVAHQNDKAKRTETSVEVFQVMEKKKPNQKCG